MKVRVLGARRTYSQRVLTASHFPATSAVDLDTDRAIQEIIRGPQFAHVTMLTIAYVPPYALRRLCGRIVSVAD